MLWWVSSVGRHFWRRSRGGCRDILWREPFLSLLLATTWYSSGRSAAIPTELPTRSSHCNTHSESGFSCRLGRCDSTSEASHAWSSKGSWYRSFSELLGIRYGMYCCRWSPTTEAAPTEMLSSLSWCPSHQGQMFWRNGQLDLQCFVDVGVFGLVCLLSEEMTSCNFIRQCSKSQLWAQP